MKIYDKKRLVFSFYLTNDWMNNETNILHINLLFKYINIFNEVVFCLVIDDDVKSDVINDFQKNIINACCGDVIFKVYKNTNYRESLVLYNEIAQRLKTLDGVTFFAHNKGVSNGYLGDENVKMWICALYYFSFEFELPFDFLNGPMAYGPLKMCCNNDFYVSSGQNIHDWYYAGTFFWLKGQQLYFYMKSNNIEIPDLTNRWYSEMFLGNTMPNTEGWSYNDRYLVNYEFRGFNVCKMIQNLYNGDEDTINSFLNYFIENKI